MRRAASGGLLADMSILDGGEFRADRLAPEVRSFYEQTAAYRMDVWSETFFPGSIGLWLLVTTISRKVNQLNFPLRALATAKGMDSEIVLLKERDDSSRYAGWYRRLAETGHAIYTGFYISRDARPASALPDRAHPVAAHKRGGAMFKRLLIVMIVLSIPGATATAQIHRVAQMNTDQIRSLDRSRTVVILTGGILGQHGPHLPSFTDGYANEWLAQRLADAIVARLPRGRGLGTTPCRRDFIVSAPESAGVARYCQHRSSVKAPS